MGAEATREPCSNLARAEHGLGARNPKGKHARARPHTAHTGWQVNAPPPNPTPPTACPARVQGGRAAPVSYTHLRAHETSAHL
eukprot:6488103-Alexandrium_andersonii.AAC.1